MSDELRDGALEYHRYPAPGKLAVLPTKPLANQRDLALAYSPGVAYACEEIVQDAGAAAEMTARGNLVGVVTNGSAVLGLGNIGPLASKPVMEGKAVLFRKFAGIDVFDIEVDESDPEKLVEIVAALEPTFGGINLEDIKAPDCFTVEESLKERMGIPVFHDDQHGTAITVTATALNGLRVVGKDPSEVKLVTAGAGAAALACLDLLVGIGVKRENITVTDIAGVVYTGRTEEMDPYKARYARDTDERTLAEAMRGADVFLGLSAPNVVTPEMCKAMADRPLILALANPNPEIRPELAREARPDAVIATGRSDYPNQTNNVLCFPYIFRGALDVGASAINEEMKKAAVYAIADLATEESHETVMAAYAGEDLNFGPEYLIPKPFDPRLSGIVSTAVARAAMDSGVARHAIADLDAYRASLDASVYKSALLMRPVFDAAATAARRIVFAEGEDERVLRAAQAILEETTETPILIGRPSVIDRRCERMGLEIRPGRDFNIVNPEDDPRYRDYWGSYHEIMKRRGVTPDLAKAIMRTNSTAIGAVMVHREEADSLICGTFGEYRWHLNYVTQVLGTLEHRPHGSLSMMILEDGPLFIADTHVHSLPTPEQLAESAIGAARHVRRFGLTPNVALCSQSQFGNQAEGSGKRLRAAIEILDSEPRDFAYEGEMNVDAALDPDLRGRLLPGNRMEGTANILIFAHADAASGVRNILKMKASGLEVGPILMGMGNRAHVVTPGITARGLLNMAAIAGTPVAHYG